MAKKIRFPLEMDGGIEVRDVEALRKNFSLSRMLEYVKNGKLIVWLKDRYANELADAVAAISSDDPEIEKRICEIFDIEYSDAMHEDLEKAAERADRIERLKEFSENPDFIRNIDQVAFDQDELYDLLDEGQNTVYLCGDRFSIPISKGNMTYIGINNPVAVIESKVEVDWIEKRIVFKGITFDEKYQKVVDSAEETKQKLYSIRSDAVKSGNVSDRQNDYPNIKYNYDSYLHFMLSPKDTKEVTESFDKLSEQLVEIRYDVDANIRSVKASLTNAGIIGIGIKYLEGR